MVELTHERLTGGVYREQFALGELFFAFFGGKGGSASVIAILCEGVCLDG